MVMPTTTPYNTAMVDVPPATIRIQPGAEGDVQIMSVNGLAANNQAELASLWMTVPQPIAGVPPGLEYLTMVDQIVVHQLLEFREIMLGYQTKNKYVLLNANGEQVFYAFEESTLSMRCCCDANRGFIMHILDNFQNEVLRITRPFKCWGGGCGGIFAGIDCCSYECSIEAPPGNVIGSVVQRRACCASSFDVKDDGGQLVLTIDGPFIACGRNVEFPITTPSGAASGNITKKWRGFLREMYTNADTFSVSFPMNLDVKSKALLLGATFMIDFAEFEHPKNI